MLFSSPGWAARHDVDAIVLSSLWAQCGPIQEHSRRTVPAASIGPTLAWGKFEVGRGTPDECGHDRSRGIGAGDAAHQRADGGAGTVIPAISEPARCRVVDPAGPRSSWE